MINLGILLQISCYDWARNDILIDGVLDIV